MENPEHQREQAANFYKFHKMCWVFIVLVATILQTWYKPFETHYRKAVAFVVTILIYFSSLLAKLALGTNGRNHVIVNKLSSFLGVLAVILPILIIVPAVGWLALGTWGCVFGIVVHYSYLQIRNELLDAVEEIRTVMNTLRNGDANEQQVNGMADENRQQHQNANEQQVNGMLDENQQQVNGMLDENQQQHQNANEQQVNGMPDENQQQHQNGEQLV